MERETFHYDSLDKAVDEYQKKIEFIKCDLKNINYKDFKDRHGSVFLREFWYTNNDIYGRITLSEYSMKMQPVIDTVAGQKKEWESINQLHYWKSCLGIGDVIENREI